MDSLTKAYLKAQGKKPEVCKNCSKTKELHKAGTLDCPIGRLFRGSYRHYHAIKKFEKRIV